MEEVFNILFDKYAEKYVVPKNLKINVSIVENINKSSSEFLEKYGRNISNDNLI